MSNVTIVTGLWNIGRGELSEGWSRSFDHYLSKLSELLIIENNMIIFGEKELKDFVFKYRKEENTLFVERKKEWFKNTVPFDKIQQIREDKNWQNQASWLKESTQAKLEWYNPLVMSKMFLLNDAKILDKFDSDHLYWIDAGITNTAHIGYFTHDKIQNKFTNLFSKFSFLAFPYKAEKEIHGFSYPKINEYAENNVELVCRGGFFGGPKETISDINAIYHSTLENTLKSGYMGTEESVFSIMLYKNSDIIDYVELKENGLISKFCEDIKNDKCFVKNISGKKSKNENLNVKKTALYVITFNSPNQFQGLLQTMSEYDKDFLEKPKKILLDNSTDESTFEKYKKICENYDFEHIKKDNLGICGGRQFIAEHAKENDFDFYFFFEDDMFFNLEKTFCRNGFSTYVENLYDKVLKIMKKSNYDFLKLSFTEFYGDNKTQWSWYNVPQEKREKMWPEKPFLPKSGLDPNPPKTKFKNISTFGGLSYIDGEIYYCNWPQIVSKYGNCKMFLDTTWTHPFEQTWMSHMYQKNIEGDIQSAVLLLSPIAHNRFEHYSSKLRKES